MSDNRIICIICPIGCTIDVSLKNNQVSDIKGHKCKRGESYARAETLSPHRILTTSVLVKQGRWPLVSVKTTKPIPKDCIFEVLSKIKEISVTAPVKSGQVIIENVMNTGSNIIATKNVSKNETY